MAALPQHLEALKKGNSIRLERARLHRLVEAGEVPVSTLILHPPACFNSKNTAVTIAELLSWQKRWGRARAESFLRDHSFLEMKPTVKISALSEGRRRQLARAVVSA